MKIRYTFNWATMRYEQRVGMYKPRNAALPSSEHIGFGRCELVSRAVKQTGN
jgi:hypothetical protein